jgi:hypothetical protein
MWNFLLRLEPESTELGFKNIVGTADGSHTLATRNDESFQFPYYYKDGSAEKWSGEYFIQRFSTTAPPFKAGESLVIRDSIDPKNPRQAWQYLVGQRRCAARPPWPTTRRTSSPPAPTTSTRCRASGPLDRFEWKLVGKRRCTSPTTTPW